MAKTYTIASDEGAERYDAAVGDAVALDLTKEQELALVAAGWLEHEKKGKEAKS